MFMVPKMNYPAPSSGELNLYPPQEDLKFRLSGHNIQDFLKTLTQPGRLVKDSVYLSEG